MPKVGTYVRLTEGQRLGIARLSTLLGLPQGELIRRAISEYVTRQASNLRRKRVTKVTTVDLDKGKPHAEAIFDDSGEAV